MGFATGSYGEKGKNKQTNKKKDLKELFGQSNTSETTVKKLRKRAFSDQHGLCTPLGTVYSRKSFYPVYM